MRDRDRELDMAHSFPAHPGGGDLDPASFADYPSVPDPSVFAAMAFPVLDRPEDLRIVVVGGIPGYTFAMSYFREGLYAPTSDQTKLVRGATLTKAGR